MEVALTVTLLRMPQVEAVIGLKKSKIHQLISEGNFPAGVKLTKRSRAWRSDEVEAWIESRPKIIIHGEVN